MIMIKNVLSTSRFQSDFEFLLMLDRDDTLTNDQGYSLDVKSLNFNAELLEILKNLDLQRVFVGIASNQSAVGRGIFPEEKLRNFTAFIFQELERQGVKIDIAVYCLHNPLELECNCRKPKPGMLTALSELVGVPVEKSIFIGNSDLDRSAAEVGGVEFYFVSEIQAIKKRLSSFNIGVAHD